MVCSATGRGGEAAPPSFHHCCGQEEPQSHSNPPHRLVALGRMGLEPHTIIYNLPIHSWNSCGFVICKTSTNFTTSLSGNPGAPVSPAVPRCWWHTHGRSSSAVAKAGTGMALPERSQARVQSFPTGRTVSLLPVKPPCPWFGSLPLSAGSC